LKEEHKRQIREMARTTGLFIVKLVRTRIGNLRLGNLKPGEFRALTPDEVKKILEQASESADSNASGRKVISQRSRKVS